MLNGNLAEQIHVVENSFVWVGIMRFVSSISLVAASLSLAACAGGGGDNALLLAKTLEACVKCGAVSVTGSDPATDPGTGTDPGGIPPVDPSNGSPGANNGNGGNTTSLATGDPVIALEAGTVVSDKAAPSLGKLTLTAGSPNKAKLEVDTNTANNNKWAVPKEMNQYTRAASPSGPALLANAVGWGAGGGSAVPGGVTYNEYRAYQNSNTDGYDELLQVWTFGDSYAAQYRDETSGSETADKQAWAFGGMTTGSVTPGTKASGTATYNGRFGSTAITRNWLNSDDSNQQVNYNNSWRVNGSSQTTVNFDTNAVAATLTPEMWETEADYNNWSGFVAQVNAAAPGVDPNYAAFMSSQIKLNGTVTKTTTGNSIAGDASMNSADGWLSDGTNNPFYGAVYGTNGTEVTGVFATTAVDPYPYGGNTPANNPTRGYINHSGAFNGDCAGAGCPTITP